MDDWIDGAKVEISDVQFYGFSGTDSCGRSNVAITNDAAGIGRGKQGNAATGNYGFAFCQPIFVDGLHFGEIPLHGRLKFAWGSASDGDDLDYGFSECIVYDLDHSLEIESPSWDRNEPQLLISAAPRRWPDTYQKYCQDALDNPNWWDTGDGHLNAINRCPPWLRNDGTFLSATEVPTRQGVVHSAPAYSDTDDNLNVQAPDWGGRDAKVACTAIDDIGGLDCHGVDYIYLMNFVQRKAVSGSEVLYGPVGMSTCSVPNGEPNLIVQDPEEFPHHTFTGGTGPWVCKNEKDGGKSSGSGRGARCLVQPNTYFLVNGGCYHMHYTGDIGLFQRNTFTMLGAGSARPRRTISDQTNPEWGVMLKILYLWPGEINVYYNERFVPAVGRLDHLTIDAPAGSNYYHPQSREMTFVVKADMLADRVKLKLLKAVQVSLVIQVPPVSGNTGGGGDLGSGSGPSGGGGRPPQPTPLEMFDAFFVDNSVDPATLPDELVAQLPPSYVASYNPDNGNIVNQNPFVRNMASALRINPGRIRVTNIVPGNRRRLQDGSDGGGGLEINFEVSEVDLCVEMQCDSGTCDNGVCTCDRGWYGKLCDVNPCVGNVASPCVNGTCVPTSAASKRCACNEGWAGALCDREIAEDASLTAAPTAAPLASPSVSPTSQPMVLEANATKATEEEAAMEMDPFAELLNIAAILVAKATSGALDTGYKIDTIDVVLPSDDCGVSGGDGTTCVDFCGLANGDNSTCADACGFPNGDNSTCVDSCGVPNGGNACVYSSMSDLNAYGMCVSKSEVQRVRIVADMSGPFFLSFNDETTGQLTMPYVEAADVKQALVGLDSIGNVEVIGLLEGGRVFSVSPNATLDFLVVFESQESQPPNQGELPLLTVNVSSATNTDLQDATTVTHLCRGAYEGGYTYEEQVVSVMEQEFTAGATHFALKFNSVVTPDIPVDATATELRLALAENELLLNRIDVFAVKGVSLYEYDTAGVRTSWLVRMYPAASSELMSLSAEGVPGDLPALSFRTAGQGFVTEVVKGDLPASWIRQDPAEAQSAQAMAAEAVFVSNRAAFNDKMSNSNNNETSLAAILLAGPIEVVDVVHVCGDGKRTTVEDCDDGNNADRDGCSATCVFEAGWACSNWIGEVSECTRPPLPIANLRFRDSVGAHVDEGQRIEEGQRITFAVELDKNVTAALVSCDIHVFAISATASAEEGDFLLLDRVVSIPTHESQVLVDFASLDDGVWDEGEEVALVKIELANENTGCVLGRDVDMRIWIVDLNQAPTAVPTATPTANPTTPECQNGLQDTNEADIDCGGSDCAPCGIGATCQTFSDCRSGNCEAGTCVTPAPTAVPTITPSVSSMDSPTDVPATAPPSTSPVSTTETPTTIPTSISCMDHERNGDETDLDCGGSCSGCNVGKACSLDSDCNEGNCNSGSCAAPTTDDMCGDGMLSGDETDTDCGGSCSRGCNTGARCNSADDCQINGICTDEGRCFECLPLERPEQNVCVSACADACISCTHSDDPLACVLCAEEHYMVAGSVGECQPQNVAVIKATIVLGGIAPVAFTQSMQNNFRTGMAEALGLLIKDVAIRKYYLEEERRRRLQEGEDDIFVDVAITVDEHVVKSVAKNLSARLADGTLKNALNAAGVDVQNLHFEHQPTSISREGVLDDSFGPSEEGPSVLAAAVVIVSVVLAVGLCTCVYCTRVRGGKDAGRESAAVHATTWNSERTAAKLAGGSKYDDPMPDLERAGSSRRMSKDGLPQYEFSPKAASSNPPSERISSQDALASIPATPIEDPLQDGPSLEGPPTYPEPLQGPLVDLTPLAKRPLNDRSLTAGQLSGAVMTSGPVSRLDRKPLPAVRVRGRKVIKKVSPGSTLLEGGAGEEGPPKPSPVEGQKQVPIPKRRFLGPRSASGRAMGLPPIENALPGSTGSR
jgi:hypothetical protein